MSPAGETNAATSAVAERGQRTRMQSRNLYQRLNSVQAEVIGVNKDERNQHHGYSYAGHDAVTEAVRASLVLHGVDQTVSVDAVEETPDHRLRVYVTVTWTNVDAPTEQKSVRSLGEAPSGGKGGPQPQHVGVAVSYAVKFAMLKNFLLVGDPTQDVEQFHEAVSYDDPAPAPLPPPSQYDVRGASDYERFARVLSVVGTQQDLNDCIDAMSRVRHSFAPDQTDHLISLIESAQDRIGVAQ